jgi:hypothetical protein
MFKLGIGCAWRPALAPPTVSFLTGVLPTVGVTAGDLRSNWWRNGRRILGVGSGESSRKLPRVNARECDVWPGAFEAPELERSKQGLTTLINL